MHSTSLKKHLFHIAFLQWGLLNDHSRSSQRAKVEGDEKHQPYVHDQCILAIDFTLQTSGPLAYLIQLRTSFFLLTQWLRNLGIEVQLESFPLDQLVNASYLQNLGPSIN